MARDGDDHSDHVKICIADWLIACQFTVAIKTRSGFSRFSRPIHNLHKNVLRACFGQCISTDHLVLTLM